MRVLRTPSIPGRFACRRSFATGLSLVVLLASAAAPAVAEEGPTPVKLCLDPDNLPFSSADPKQPGLYGEIGALIGEALGRPIEPIWGLTFFGKRMVRTTLLARQCDATIGLPGDKSFMGPKVIFSKPMFEIGYALVLPPALEIRGFADLVGKKIGVQFNSGPQNMLATHEDVTSVTFLEPEAALAALARHEIDAAFVWGPVAGYLNKTLYAGAYKIVPVAGEGLQWPAAVGFAKGQTELRDAVDAALSRDRAAIEALEEKYGLPKTAPIRLAEAPAPTAAAIRLADAATTVSDAPKTEATAAPTAPAVDAAAPAGGGSETAALQPGGIAMAKGNPAEGHEIFNGTCAHCHGPDAIQAERRINLRLLQHRYGEDMDEVFIKTVTHGRPDKGMPNWSEVFSMDQFADILAYLHTVQAEP